MGLEHPDLRLVELPLIFHQLLLVMLECRHHAVEALGQLPQLIVLIGRDVHIQIVLNHFTDGTVEPLDGQEHLPAQPQAHQNGHHHAHQDTAGGDGGQKPPGALVHSLGMLQNRIESHFLLHCRPVGVLLALQTQRLAVQKLLAQLGRHGGGQGGLGGIDRPPVAVQQQKIVSASVLAVQQLVEVRPGHGDHEIACLLTAGEICAAPRSRTAVFPSPPSTWEKTRSSVCRAA